jgi:hypothetical protein
MVVFLGGVSNTESVLSIGDDDTDADKGEELDEGNDEGEGEGEELCEGECTDGGIEEGDDEGECISTECLFEDDFGENDDGEALGAEFTDGNEFFDVDADFARDCDNIRFAERLFSVSTSCIDDTGRISS